MAPNRQRHAQRYDAGSESDDDMPEAPPPGQESPSRTRGRDSPKAIEVSGVQGKFDMINGRYEPMAQPYNGKLAWCASNIISLYLFHSGKKRWVISKRLDDGTHCYAFIVDEEGCDSPTQCRGYWQNSGHGQWEEDPRMKVRQVAASTDPFVRLRLSVEDTMQDCGITNDKSINQMWRKLDKNSDNVVDISEIEEFVRAMVKVGTWPKFMSSKSALEKAYDKTAKEDGNGDDKIDKDEFPELLLNIFWFTKLDEIFQNIDTSDDQTIDKTEFIAGLQALGVTMSPEEANAEWRSLDSDNSQVVDFSEFCVYIRKRLNPSPTKKFDNDNAQASKEAESMRKKGGAKATSGLVVRKKNFQDFDELEKKLKDICKEPNNKGVKKLWSRLDFNGNGVVSLAEIDKFVVESYPLLNHKPALIRAQKATLSQGNGDDWVQRKEFKMLLVNLFYYNKLFWLFDQCDSDKDRRMDFKEFQFCLTMCGLKMSENKARTEFEKLDTNGGGIILFDEFCAYFVQKNCPPEMTSFIEEDMDEKESALIHKRR